ncbi:MAG: acyltransferase family protein, partial [Massilia sp.]
RWTWAVVGITFGAGMVVRYLVWNALVDDQTNYFRYIYYSTFCRFDELVAGVALALAKYYHPRAWRRWTVDGRAALCAGAAVTALACWLFLQDREGLAVTVFAFPMLALGFGLLILAALSGRNWLRSVRVPGAGKLALWSYAIYLTHKQLGILARAPLEKLGYGPESFVAIAIIMVVSVLAGWLMFWCVETPFMVLRQRWVPVSTK